MYNGRAFNELLNPIVRSLPPFGRDGGTRPVLYGYPDKTSVRSQPHSHPVIVAVVASKSGGPPGLYLRQLADRGDPGWLQNWLRLHMGKTQKFTTESDLVAGETPDDPEIFGKRVC